MDRRVCVPDRLRPGQLDRSYLRAALLWRLDQDLNESRREQVERFTLRIVGWCFVALAAYIGYESGSALIRHKAPERSIPGIIVATVSVVVMPILAKAKRHVAAGISSTAMRADSRQTDFCTFLSAILLGGLLLNALFGWWWADPVAGLVMVPIIAKEGLDGIEERVAAATADAIDPRRGKPIPVTATGIMRAWTVINPESPTSCVKYI